MTATPASLQATLIFRKPHLMTELRISNRVGNMRIGFKPSKLESLKIWAKIVVVNLLMLLLLLVVAEILLRSIWTIQSCINFECDFSRITGVKVRAEDRASDIGISRFDELLGHVPREGFSGIINAPGWSNAKVTITKDGFRSNDSARAPLLADVLAVGDSFTFGAQVSDNETWPACLERKLGRGVDNGGVDGFGAAQALRRATPKLAEKRYSALVLSIFVGDDFNRDRYSYRFGFPKPAVIHTENGIAWSAVPDPNVPGTKYNPSSNKFLSLAYERSQLFAAVLDRVSPEANITGDRLTIVHPNAADENEIIDWTLRKFSNLDMKNKILLLQYASPNDVAKKKEIILRTAHELSLKVVDTSMALKGAKERDLWYTYGRHHTPLGNQIVCSYLFEHGFASQQSGR